MHAGVSAESQAYLASCTLDFVRGVETIMDIVYQDDALATEGQRPLLDVNARESLVLFARMGARMLNDQCVEHLSFIDKCVKRQEQGNGLHGAA